MTLWIIFLFVFVVAGNDFHVDTNSLKKDTHTWTMKLNNKAAGDESAENKPIRVARATIEGLDKKVLHVKIVDEENKRWEAPLINPSAGANYNKAPIDSLGFELVNSPFGFKITDPELKELIIDSTPGSFEFKDKYLELGYKLAGDQLMGLGERITERFFVCHDRDSCKYTLWGKDEPSPYDDGGGNCLATYGQQPFYMLQLKKTRKFIGVLFLNSNDQDVTMKREGGSVLVTHRNIGGVFDLYYFYSGEAESVIRTYHDLIGRAYLPPLWSMGYHQCRYGWKNLDKVKDVVKNFEANDLPLDVVWADIDYMKDYADFTIDYDRYGGLKEFVEELHKKKMRWVPIIDAGLKYDKKDKYFILGEEHNAFIKSAKTKQTLIGKVWPGPAVFITWYSPYAATLWKLGLTDLYKQVAFDGIWLDMNEIANFCYGECPPTSEENTSMFRRHLGADPHDPTEFDNLPYKPGGCDPTQKTISMTGYHYSENDYEDKVRKEYNTHSLWNLYESKVTYEFLAENHKQRPYVLTRSNFPGSGLFTTKWLGDNYSRWEFLRYSIVGIYNYQLFGMPFTGSDMCGFMESTNEELCARWMQLGAFYPFSRNHNDIRGRDQEPYVLGEKVMKATRNSMRQKYSIILYYYTKLFEASLYGGSLIHPLFFDYPTDDKVYDKAERIFMIGDALLVIPILYPGDTKVRVYLPNENWYSLKTLNQVTYYTPNAEAGKEVEFEDNFDFVNVLIKGGRIIPYQDAHTPKVRRIDDMKDLPSELIIAPDQNGKASGTWVVDDGISLQTIEAKKYIHFVMNFTMSANLLSINKTNTWSGKNTKSEEVSKITIFGAEAWSKVSRLCVVTTSGQSTMMGAYNSEKKILTFENPPVKMYWKDVKFVKFNIQC